MIVLFGLFGFLEHILLVCVKSRGNREEWGFSTGLTGKVENRCKDD